MRNRASWALAILPVLQLALAQSDERAESPRALPFAEGETLVYDVHWSLVPAGEVVATLARAKDGARDAYEVVTTAQSRGFVALLFKVDNEFRSVIDPDTLCSERISKKIREGRRRRDTRIVFDAARRLATLDEIDLKKPQAPPRHAENEIPECVSDVVSAFYYVRRRALRVGEPLHMPLNDGGKTHLVTVEVQAREQVETTLGTRLALRLEPKVFGSLYRRKGRMLVWLSDDDQRLPLRIEASVAVGTITGTLKSVTTAPRVADSPR